jgi:hypothetical protein
MAPLDADTRLGKPTIMIKTKMITADLKILPAFVNFI